MSRAVKISKRKKIILLGSTALLVTVFSVWLLTLFIQVRGGLNDKNLFRTTEFYAEGVRFSINESWSLSELSSELESHGFKRRIEGTGIVAKDYRTLSFDETQQIIQNRDVDVTEAVLLKSSDENLVLIILHEGHITHIFSGENGLDSNPSIQLEPKVIAQYIGSDSVRQIYKSLGEIPPICLRSVLAIEDANFLEHSGVSYTGILRAAWSNLFSSGPTQGGSTITQQTVKNYFLNSERTLKRKFIELFMSFFLEALATKDEILETYLNIIYMGQQGPYQVRGLGAAARYYFDKDLGSLGLSECSLLAAVLNSPGLYDPYTKPENAKKRQQRVLARMQELGMITEEDKLSAESSDLPKNKPNLPAETAPYFLLAAQEELSQLGISYEGKKVYTSLNLKHQNWGQEAINSQISYLEKNNSRIQKNKSNHIPLEAALITVDNSTGYVTSLIGGRSYRQSQYNRALTAKRQIGSIVKPYVYLASLLERERTRSHPSHFILDEPWTYRYEGQKWSPENYGKKYYGEVPLYFALSNSLNVPAAKIGLEVGLNHVAETMHALGVESEIPELPALTLGAVELSLKEVAQSYLTLAKMGSYLPLRFVHKVSDDKGQIIYQAEDLLPEVSVDPVTTGMLVSMMKLTGSIGTGQSIGRYGFTHPFAGKTGTTSENKDTWFAGFTPYYTAVTWLGYDQNQSTGLTGASGSIPIWAPLMRKMHERKLPLDFNWPPELLEEPFYFEHPEVDKPQEVLLRIPH